MFTLNPFAVPVQHHPVSDVAERLVGSAVSNGSSGVFSAVAIIVAIMLMGFALERVGNVVSAIWSTVKVLFSALGVAILLIAALVVLIGGLVVSALAP
jgi:hypothetical protein